jgi:hypothetical protein
LRCRISWRNPYIFPGDGTWTSFHHRHQSKSVFIVGQEEKKQAVKLALAEVLNADKQKEEVCQDSVLTNLLSPSVSINEVEAADGRPTAVAMVAQRADGCGPSG